jgi:hypothetical protein
VFEYVRLASQKFGSNVLLQENNEKLPLTQDSFFVVIYIYIGLWCRGVRAGLGLCAYIGFRVYRDAHFSFHICDICNMYTRYIGKIMATMNFVETLTGFLSPFDHILDIFAMLLQFPTCIHAPGYCKNHQGEL